MAEISALRAIDVHHHFAPPPYVAELAAKKLDPRRMLDWTPARSLEEMDRAGIAASVASITEPGIRFGDDAAARTMARACNEYGAQLALDHPGRFGFFASLPFPDIDGSLREIEHALETLKADGILLYTNYDRKYLGDPVFDPVLAELDRRGAVVFVHPRRLDCLQDLLPGVPQSTIEFGADISRAAARLLFTGAASRYARIRFILPHAGGTVPFLLERFLSMAAQAPVAANLPRGLVHELRKFYYDVSQAANAGPLVSLKHLAPVSQMLFGTDFPFRGGADQLKGLAACGLFDAAELADIARNNAARLLPRFRS